MATPTVAERLRRLLAMLTWLAQVGEASIDEASARFGLAPTELVAELELAACCGLPPYTPDQLMEIVVTDSTVSARLGDRLTRPRRLTAAEGFTLAAAARALLAVPGSDADGVLASAVEKLDRVLAARSLVVELDAPEMLEPVRRALADGRQLVIGYYTASRDELTHRRIDPARVFAHEGTGMSTPTATRRAGTGGSGSTGSSRWSPGPRRSTVAPRPTSHRTSSPRPRRPGRSACRWRRPTRGSSTPWRAWGSRSRWGTGPRSRSRWGVTRAWSGC